LFLPASSYRLKKAVRMPCFVKHPVGGAQSGLLSSSAKVAYAKYSSSCVCEFYLMNYEKTEATK